MDSNLAFKYYLVYFSWKYSYVFSCQVYSFFIIFHNLFFYYTFFVFINYTRAKQNISYFFYSKVWDFLINGL